MWLDPLLLVRHPSANTRVEFTFWFELTFAFEVTMQLCTRVCRSLQVPVLFCGACTQKWKCMVTSQLISDEPHIFCSSCTTLHL